MQSVSRYQALDSSGLKTSEWQTFRDRSAGARAPGICYRSPDAFARTSGIRGSSETATSGTWFLRLAPCHLSEISQRWRLSLCHLGVLHFFEKKKMIVPVNLSQQHHSDKRVQILGVTLSLHPSLPLAGMMAVGSFSFLVGGGKFHMPGHSIL